MKSFWLTTAWLLLLFTRTTAQCSNFYFLMRNAEVEMTIYDGKGKLTGVQTWKIREIKMDGAGTSSQVESVLVDGEGKEVSRGGGRFRCSGSLFKADLRMNLPQQQQAAFQAWESSVNEGFIEYPAILQDGQSLLNTGMSVELKGKSGLKTHVDFQQTGRKVEGKETIDSPAGTWEAYKISYEATVTTKLAGIGIPFHFKAAEWFVPGFGIVKSETYSKKGKLVASTLLTAIKK